MDLRMEVYSPELQLIDILEEFDVVYWEKQAYSPGSFKVTSRITEKTAALLQQDNVILLEGKTAGVIETIQADSTKEGSKLEISGCLLPGILSRRILWGTYNLSGTAPAIMNALVSDCCVTPTRGPQPSDRRYSFLSLADVPVGGETIRKQKTGGTLADALEEVGEANNVTWDVELDPATSQAVFYTRFGVDRSVNSGAEVPVFYSTELDDVISSSYTSSNTGTCNVALIGGQVPDEGSRVYANIDNHQTGIARRELFVDARDLSPEPPDEEPLTDEEYLALLTSRGSEKLAEVRPSQSFTADIKTYESTYEFETDFFLGDTITVTDENLGISIDAVVTGAQRSVSRNGETLTLTLGYDVPTLQKIIKRKADG